MGLLRVEWIGVCLLWVERMGVGLFRVGRIGIFCREWYGKLGVC